MIAHGRAMSSSLAWPRQGQRALAIKTWRLGVARFLAYVSIEGDIFGSATTWVVSELAQAELVEQRRVSSLTRYGNEGLLPLLLLPLCRNHRRKRLAHVVGLHRQRVADGGIGLNQL